MVTGAAGFIGSGLVKELLENGQEVVGLDNLSTGRTGNLEDVRARVGEEAWSRFRFARSDVRDLEAFRDACRGADVVLHQAALGSVPRSVERPLDSHESNVTGTLNVFLAGRDEGVERVVFASSSSVYGDDAELPKVESRTGRPLSPYAATKSSGEEYARAFHAVYDLPVVMLRYFNVFGPRQDPEGPYAAVIPRWIGALLRDEPVVIYGDGETSRDFCYLANAVQANVRAALTRDEDALGEAFNVAVGERTTLNELFETLRRLVAGERPEVARVRPVYAEFRPGDVRHSLADVEKIRRVLGYVPTHSLDDGLEETVPWYRELMGG